MTLVSPSRLTLSLVCGAVALAACDEPLGNNAELHASRPVPKAQLSATPAPNAAGIADAGASSATAGAADAGAAPYDGPYLAALFLQTPVLSEMEWPHEDGRLKDGRYIRVGYIRQGGKVPVIAKAHKKPNCVEGWYELVSGGYVCGKYATLDMNHPRVKFAPHAPDMTGPLPYQYGYNTTNGTPLYRTVPSKEEKMKLEPWLAITSSKKKVRRASTRDREREGRDIVDDTELVDAPREDTTADAGAEKPWYLREYEPGAKPMVTLDELRGDGPMARRMVKGFFLALDRSFGTANGMYWKTTGGLLAPFDKIWVQKPLTDFHGVWLSSDKPAGGDKAQKIEEKTYAFSLSGRSKKYKIDKDAKKAAAGESIPRGTFLTLTGETVTLSGTRYDEAEGGVWVKAVDVAKTRPGHPPDDLESGEKWIDVSLGSQTLVAYEGSVPVFATMVSTGRRDRNKDKDHPTPTGSFRIREKHVAATMDGDVATDGPYSIEDVPWIMYFNGSYALHGAFWHANFGHEQSHGCVNLAPEDAKTLFGWTEPHLPEGWHGVTANPDKSGPGNGSKRGTRVVVHD